VTNEQVRKISKEIWEQYTFDVEIKFTCVYGHHLSYLVKDKQPMVYIENHFKVLSLYFISLPTFNLPSPQSFFQYFSIQYFSL
jgi:hypothetical protein